MFPEPASRNGFGPSCRWTGIAVVAAIAVLAEPAAAFPIADTTDAGGNSTTTALSTPDAQDLTHQLQIAGGLPIPGGAGGAGWTIIPSVSVQEGLTDNVMQVHSPMRWDLTTTLSPEILISGQTQRVQVRVDYAPVLIVNARTGSQNALNQQLNGTATINAFEDLAFVDIRALSGVQSTRGALGLGGTIGSGGSGGFTAGSIGGLGASTSTQQNTVQTSSLGISPYLIKRFGDYGTAKIGYSFNVSQSRPVTGFTFMPFPTGGGAQQLVSNELTASFVTGQFLNDFQNTINLDFSQSHGSGSITGGSTTVSSLGAGSLTSTRQIVTDSLSYAITHTLTATASIGHERIAYSQSAQTTIDDMTWSIGGTYSPSQYTSITITYGRQQGETSISFNGHAQITPRTVVSASYTDTLGTQLENLQNQLNQGVVSANGTFVNGQTGGQLFGATNGLAVQSGVFHFKTLTATATTQLDRDTVSLTFNASTGTSASGNSAGAGGSQSSDGIILSWVHELRPDMRLSTSASYNLTSGGTTGSGQSIAFNTSLIYTLTDSLSASMRYSFFRSTSQNTAYDLYEDIFVVGFTKKF